MSNGAVLVISGTGGAGKGTVVERLRSMFPDLWWSISWATRAPRPDELDGDHYYFRTVEQFETLRDAGGFLECADVYGVLKGTPKAPLDAAVSSGCDALLEMDIQGAVNVARLYPDAEVAFVVAPSADAQAQRLARRQTDSPTDIETRLSTAVAEEQRAREAGFHIVVNDDIDRAVAQVAAILTELRDRSAASKA